jgi:DNA-binding NtrC family response regulator
MNILVIDDCPTLQDFCNVVLSFKNHQVYQTTSYNYQSPLISKGNLLDIILFNVNPIDAKDALEVHKMAKSINPDIQMILMVTDWPSLEVTYLKALGCKALIMPFIGEDLIDMVEICAAEVSVHKQAVLVV